MSPRSVPAALAADHARLAGPAHVGVLVPWANTIVETELPRMGLEKLVFHYARLVPARRYRDADAFLAEIAAAIPAAAGQLARLELAGVLVGCTSVGFTTPGAYADTPVTDAFEAIIAGLRRLDASRVVLATPYPSRHTAHEADSLTNRAVHVSDHASLDLGLLDDFAGLTVERIRGLLTQLRPAAVAEADAVVLSCTAWPTLAAVGRLEAELDRPVLSSNLALAWAAVHAGLAHQNRSEGGLA